MKNKEKYRDKIIQIAKEDSYNFCEQIVRNIILKRFNLDCKTTDCSACHILQNIWLEEEYEEPEPDWTKVEVDTPIIIKLRHENTWSKAHFAKFENGTVYSFAYGRTSHTSDGRLYCCEWAKLAEVENE